MTLLNVRKFLDIDPDYKMKVYRRPGVIEENADNEYSDGEGEEVCLNFQRQGQSTISNLKIKEDEENSRMFEFTYFDIVDESDISNEATI